MVNEEILNDLIKGLRQGYEPKLNEDWKGCSNMFLEKLDELDLSIDTKFFHITNLHSLYDYLHCNNIDSTVKDAISLLDNGIVESFINELCFDQYDLDLFILTIDLFYQVMLENNKINEKDYKKLCDIIKYSSLIWKYNVEDESDIPNYDGCDCDGCDCEDCDCDEYDDDYDYDDDDDEDYEFEDDGEDEEYDDDDNDNDNALFSIRIERDNKPTKKWSINLGKEKNNKSNPQVGEEIFNDDIDI